MSHGTPRGCARRCGGSTTTRWCTGRAPPMPDGPDMPDGGPDGGDVPPPDDTGDEIV